MDRFGADAVDGLSYALAAVIAIVVAAVVSGVLPALAIIAGIPPYLRHLWMQWDPQKQTWHDKAARCVVVPIDAYR